ncbi:hypothetical protein BO99DRAFT_407169 [Aspergillus violaceofuscus CBS 115571]|uniref:Uncharacterized protein n=1 Tax=Aspergillus violaceofuscus (strain CBS 115571) TaxID=1450538 RepID=A0A2V5GZM8_ASPV1|nr:hypothetical protein BO99DRAFT_407169 [Aspergillus violaceofuscus CBS 115571]
MEYLPGESQSKKHSSSSSRLSGSPSRRNAINPPAPVPAPFPGTGSGGGGFSRARGGDDGPGGISYIQVFPDLTPVPTNPFTTFNPHQAQPQPPPPPPQQQEDSSFDPPPELFSLPAGPAPPAPSFDEYDHEFPYTDPVVVPDSITQHLTTTSFSALTAHLNTSYLTPALAHVRAAYIDPYLVRPAASYLASSGGAMPDLLSVALLLVILFLSLKVLDYARRVVMFWVGLAWWLLWWASVIGVGVWLYTSGVERAARDVGWLVGLARGFLGRVFEDMERAGRQQQQQQQQRQAGVFGGNNAGFGAGGGARGHQVPLGRY